MRGGRGDRGWRGRSRGRDRGGGEAEETEQDLHMYLLLLRFQFNGFMVKVIRFRITQDTCCSQNNSIFDKWIILEVIFYGQIKR